MIGIIQHPRAILNLQRLVFTGKLQHYLRRRPNKAKNPENIFNCWQNKWIRNATEKDETRNFLAYEFHELVSCFPGIRCVKLNLVILTGLNVWRYQFLATYLDLLLYHLER